MIFSVPWRAVKLWVIPVPNLRRRLKIWFCDDVSTCGGGGHQNAALSAKRTGTGLEWLAIGFSRRLSQQQQRGENRWTWKFAEDGRERRKKRVKSAWLRCVWCNKVCCLSGGEDHLPEVAELLREGSAAEVKRRSRRRSCETRWAELLIFIDHGQDVESDAHSGHRWEISWISFNLEQKTAQFHYRTVVQRM